MTPAASPDVRNALRALQDSPARRWTARIASVLDDIEAAFHHGASRAQVHAALVANGIGISFEGFKKALYRLRRKLREAIVSTPIAAATRPDPVTSKGAATYTPPPRQPVPASPPHPTAAAQPPAAILPSQRTFRPGMIGEIARSQPDMKGLAKAGREYAAELAERKKLKAAAVASTKIDGNPDITK